MRLRRHRNTIGAGVLAGMLALGAATVAPPAAAVPRSADGASAPAAGAGATTADRLAAAVRGRAYPRLRAFQRIADRNGGNRGYDRPGFTASADYVAGRLREAGYRVWRQPVPYTDFVPDVEEALVAGQPTRRLPLLMTRGVPSTPAAGITARVAVLPPGADGCAAADYAGFTGAIAVVPRGACGFTAQQRLAARAGALAFLTWYVTPSAGNAYRFTAFTPDDFTIPMGSLVQADGEALVARARRAAVTLTVRLRAHTEQRVTENVLAETAGGDPGDVVLVGAHLDSVDEGPGINDNASTASAVLETALALAPHQRRLPGTVRFAWWGAEELIDVGSNYYVAHLTPAERRAVRVYVNGELLGSPNHVRHVWDGGPAGGHEVALRFERWFDRHGLPYEVVSPDTVGSDHEPFEAAGIPVGGLDSGLLAVKTPAEQRVFGGTAGQLQDPCYHQPCDTVDNIDRRVLDDDTQALAYVVGELATDDSAIPGR